MKRIYLIYDGRACGGAGTDDAIVFVLCHSNKEARSYRGDFGSMACYSYATENNTLIDERWEWDWHP